jgi:hypothetical protein
MSSSAVIFVLILTAVDVHRADVSVLRRAAAFPRCGTYGSSATQPAVVDAEPYSGAAETDEHLATMKTMP